MTFTTTEFAIFMAITFCIYYIVPKKLQWIVLLLANAYFYYQAGLPAMLFLVGTILLTYGAGLLIEKTGQKKIVIVTIILLLCALMVVMRMPFANIYMPLGLSFYTLQCIGYCVDVHRQMVPAEKNPAKYALYISFFPHVLQGPFEDYSELSKQLLAEHHFDYEQCVYGIYRIAFGLVKKLIIADRIGYIVDAVYETGEGYYGLTVFVVMLLYAIQLYADFSGYMDMAVGMSQMLGIKIQENFNVPYGSKSMTEFWRRWHMSLGLWFKNYVFYSVQRMEFIGKIRKAMKAKKNRYAMNVIPSVISLTVVWTLIGLWHGFDWNYLCYDWFCGLLIILAEIMKPVYDKINDSAPKIFKSKWMDVLRVIRTYIVVSFSFLLFRPATMEITVRLFKNMFSHLYFRNMGEFLYWNVYDLFLIAIPLIVMGIVDGMKYKGINVCEKLHKLPAPVRYLIYVIGLLMLYICKGDLTGKGFAYYVF